MTDPYELLPCPFCGASAVMRSVKLGSRPENFYTKYYIACNQCEIGMPMRKSYSSPYEAVKSWNTRYDSEGRRIMF